MNLYCCIKCHSSSGLGVHAQKKTTTSRHASSTTFSVLAVQEQELGQLARPVSKTPNPCPYCLHTSLAVSIEAFTAYTYSN